jgi:hypothetical protein
MFYHTSFRTCLERFSPEWSCSISVALWQQPDCQCYPHCGTHRSSVTCTVIACRGPADASQLQQQIESTGLYVQCCLCMTNRACQLATAGQGVLQVSTLLCGAHEAYSSSDCMHWAYLAYAVMTPMCFMHAQRTQQGWSCIYTLLTPLGVRTAEWGQP